MIMILTEKEVKEALKRYITRDVLGVCGQGFKGTVDVEYEATEHGDIEFRAELKMKEDKSEKL